uniref:Centrosomal protein 57kDa-like protein 1 n=1 Tax=Latimeria chalumnae TaxID=7897 RepID=M3XJM3_LATCH
MESSVHNRFLGSFYLPREKLSAFAFPTYKQAESPTVDTGSERLTGQTTGMRSASNSQALATALKTLQEKIHRLELERSKAADNFKQLSSQTTLYGKVLEHEKDLEYAGLTKQNNELSCQLSAAKARCSILEKQLEYMREMMENAEAEKNILLEKQYKTFLKGCSDVSTSLQNEKSTNPVELHTKLEKLENLERECLKLTTTQNATEDKIQQLQQKLHEEEHQRKLIQDKAAQLQTGLEMNRILLTSVSPQKEPKKKIKKKQSSKQNASLKEETSQTRVSKKHAELPFVAGKSASPSHSLRANVQNVLYMMKHYRPQMCERKPRSCYHRVLRNKNIKQEVGRPVSACSTSSSVSFEGLSELLLALQDELGQMSFEHQELVKQIHETKNTAVREDLERELDSLVKQMELKGDQISNLKKHQVKVQTLKQKAQQMKKKRTHAKSRGGKVNGVQKQMVTPRQIHGKTPPGQKSKDFLLCRQCRAKGVPGPV